jgi:hypothetical protein
MLAETGVRVTYVDCDVYRQGGSIMLQPEIRNMARIQDIPEGLEGIWDGRIVTGNSWGIRYRGFMTERFDTMLFDAGIDELLSVQHSGITVIDIPVYSMHRLSESGDGDILLAAVTRASLESEEGEAALEWLERIRRPLLFVENKCRIYENSARTGPSTHGLKMFDRFMFDPRIENAADEEILAVEGIPEWRPLFGRLASRLLAVCRGRAPETARSSSLSHACAAAD